MVRSVEEMMNIVRQRIGDSTEDSDIAFIEDISDTLNAGNSEELEKLKSENEELRKKYRDRFFETKVVKVEEPKEPEEPENTEKTTFEDLFKED